MLGEFETGEDFAEQATHTDSGIEIVSHALHGDGCPIIEIQSIPFSAVEQTPIFFVNGVKYVYTSTDDVTGRLQFRLLDYLNDDPKFRSPVLTSEFDENQDSAIDLAADADGSFDPQHEV